MRRVKARLVGSLSLLFVALVLVCVAPEAFAVAVPPGPRVAILRLNLEKGGAAEVVTAGGIPLAGGSTSPVIQAFGASGAKGARGPVPSLSGAPVWLPDGTRILFAASSRARESQPLAIFSVSAEGGTPKRVPGTTGGIDPVLSPDGQTLAFARTRMRTAPNSHGGEETVYESTTTWTTNLITGASRRLTDWHDGVAISPSSFSPDGLTLAATEAVGRHSASQKATAIALPVGGGPSKVILVNALEPVYSPDGTHLAFLRGPYERRKSKDGGVTTGLTTDLYTTALDGSHVRRLTSTPNAIELAPSWDSTGQRLAFTRLHPFGSEQAFFLDGEIAEVNADGTCPEALISHGGLLVGGAWQPGPGREAGPILC